MGRKVVDAWNAQHRKEWRTDVLKPEKPNGDSWACQVDEYPPIYLLNEQSPEYIKAGQNVAGGQLVRQLPGGQNGGAASMWRGLCFYPVVTQSEISNQKLKDAVDNDPKIQKLDTIKNG